MIHSIKIRNFGPHKSLDLDFSEGINLVIGRNGVGKSNIVYAIGWVLLGARSLPSDVNQDDIIHDGTGLVKVIMDMDISGKRYQFFRSYDGTQVIANAHVFDDSGSLLPIAATALGVNQFLAREGLDSTALSTLVSFQDELTRIIKDKPSVRARLFDHILSTDEILRALELSREYYSSLDNKRPSSLDVDIDVLLFDINQLSSLLEATREDLKGHLKAQSEFRSQLENYRMILSGMIEINNQIGIVVSHMATLKSKLDSLNSSIRGEELTIALTPEESQENIEKSLSRLRDEVVKENTNRAMLAKVLQTLSLEIHDSESQLSNLKLFTLGNTCPICDSDVRTSPGVLNSKIRSLESDLAVKKEEHVIHSTKLRDIEGGLYCAEEEIEKSLSFLDLFREVEGAKKKRHKLAQDRKDIQDKFNEALEKHNKLQLGLPDATFVENQRQAERDLQDTDNLIIKTSDKISKMESKLWAWQTQLSNYRTLLDEYNETVSIKESWKSAYEELKKFKSYLIIEALEWVSVRSTQILNQIKSLPDITSSSKIVIDHKLEFWIDTDGVRVPVKRYSGGQKSAFSVCLRIALSEFFSSQLGLDGMLILDAAFESMDSGNREATAVALTTTGQKQALVFMYEDVPSIEATRIYLGNVDES